SSLLRPLLPVRFHFRFAIVAFSLARAESNDLSRLGTAQALLGKPVEYLLAAGRECHDVLSAIAAELPCAICLGEVDAVAEPLHFEREFRAVDCGAKPLGTEYPHWIEAAPCSVRPPRQVQHDHMCMELRIRQPDCIGRASGQMIKAGADNVGTD